MPTSKMKVYPATYMSYQSTKDKHMFSDQNYSPRISSTSQTTLESNDKGCYSRNPSLFRVAFIGGCLSFFHSIGILISGKFFSPSFCNTSTIIDMEYFDIFQVYLLVERLLEPDMPEKPINHVCTTAFFCPFYRSFGGLTGISIQLTGSVCGLCINLLLTLGAKARVAWALLLWLLCYAIAICGCIVLLGIMLNLLMIRSQLVHDVHYTTMMLTIVPVLLCLLYVICWYLVWREWYKMKRSENNFIIISD